MAWAFADPTESGTKFLTLSLGGVRGGMAWASKEYAFKVYSPKDALDFRKAFLSEHPKILVVELLT